MVSVGPEDIELQKALALSYVQSVEEQRHALKAALELSAKESNSKSEKSSQPEERDEKSDGGSNSSSSEGTYL